MIRIFAIAFLWFPIAAGGTTLELEGKARLVAQTLRSGDSYPMPTAPFDGTKVPSRTIEGAIIRQVWRIDARSMTTLQIMTPLRTRLTAAGFDILFECRTAACGGFDFRFGTPVEPPPEMIVNLRNFRFLSAEHKPSGQIVSLLVSATPNAAYVQLVSGTPEGANAVLEFTSSGSGKTQAPKFNAPHPEHLPVPDALEQNGRAVLDDLVFESSSAKLGDGPFDSLVALSAFLTTNPENRIVLVGHTDSVGTLDGNIALSKRRALSVLERLSERHGVTPAQLTAEGVGYLAPITSNLTETGRRSNRRVEAVLLPSK